MKNYRLSKLFLLVISVIFVIISTFSFLSCSDSGEEQNSDGDSEQSETDTDQEITETSENDTETEKELEQIVYNWPQCEDKKTDKTLKEMAEYFDKVSKEQHIAGDGLMRNLYLKENLTEVERWHHVPNTILWSGIYIATQSLRYAVTKNEEAQENVRKVLKGLEDLTKVTGVSGLYGRSMINPNVNYNNVPADSNHWTNSPAEGYEGWRFNHDVSKDGYAGIMMGYALAMDHLTDKDIRETVAKRLQEIGDHLLKNKLQIIDVSGKVTEHGRLFHSAMDDYPGFNAMLASSWIKIIATATEDKKFDDFYYGCLMKTQKDVDCPKDMELADLGDYITSMEETLMLFLPACKQSYDNFDMTYQAIYPYIHLEKDADLRNRLTDVVRKNMFYSDNPAHQSLDTVGNTFFTFSYAALVGDSPEKDTKLKDAIDLAICTMRDFPHVKIKRYIPKGTEEEVCTSRLDNPVTTNPIPLSKYHFDNYLWRLDFFEIQEEEIKEDKQHIYSPEDFLLAYWMGRYHGFIKENQ